MLWLLFSVLARAPAPEIDPRIFAGKSAGERASFLVVLRERADLSGAAAISDRSARRQFVFDTLRAHAEATQAPLRERLKREGLPFRPHFLVNLLEVEANEAAARALAREHDLLAVAANLPAPLVLPPLAPSAIRRTASDVEPNIVLIGAPEVWARGFRGEGIVVGIADTGIAWTHPALQGQYRGWDGAAASHDYNWHDAVHDARPMNACGSDSPEPCDDQGHGTAVTGLAVGDGGQGHRIGAAPGARFIGCRNMDIGEGTPARYIECFEFFLAPTDPSGENPRPDLGADIVNSSWTCPEEEGCTDPDVLRSGVEALRSAGIAQAFAAGNSGASCGTLTAVPAIYEAALTVGATDLFDAIAFYSAFGPVARDGSLRLKPDLVAPALGIESSSVSAIPGSGDYAVFGGTSGATPQVSGAIALLWSEYPWLRGDVDATEELLKASAVALTSSTDCEPYSGSAVPNAVFGWGRLDVARAQALATARGEPQRPGVGRPEARIVPPRPR